MKTISTITLIRKALIAFTLSGCAISRPLYVEVELTGFPENSAAVAMGTIKALIEERGKGRADLNFELAGQKFVGQMQIIDGSVTTDGKSNVNTQSVALGVAGQNTAAIAEAKNQSMNTVSTVHQASSNGMANALSDKGMTMSCEYVVNNKQLTGTGSCEISNGAKYRFYAKPIRAVLTDGTSRPM